MIPLPIANGFYESESLPISAQACINWYPNIVAAPALSQETLLGTPGINQLGTTGSIKQINRGMIKLLTIPYLVNGENLYSFDRTVVAGVETFSFTNLGAIPGTDRVFMAINTTQLMIVTGGEGYIYTPSLGTLVTITDPDFKASGTPLTVSFIASYFVCVTDNDKVIISAQNDGVNWNALDFISADADPDPLVNTIGFLNQSFIFGTNTAQVAVPIATSGVPLQIQAGFELSKGCSAPHSLIRANDTIMWVGGGVNESPAIWQLAGSAAVKISTTAIDTLLQGFTDAEIADIFSLSYAQKGAYFVNFYLPTTCLSYNTITGRWNEIQSDIESTSGIIQTTRSRVNSLVTAYSRVLVADFIDGRIGEMNPDIYSEYDREIKRTVVTQPFANQGNAMTVPTLELTMEAGVGNEDVVDPQIRMSRSKDAKTFTGERFRAIGKVGEYNRRTIWRRNGRVGRFELFKFVLSDKVKPVIIKLEAEII